MARVALVLAFFLAQSVVVDSEDKMSESVKLTMKQGLIMNQVLAIYALDNVEDPRCKNHTDLFKNGLRRFEPWALKSLDANHVV
jgi:hypothetical protein